MSNQESTLAPSPFRNPLHVLVGKLGGRNLLMLALLVVVLFSVSQGIANVVRGLDVKLLWLVVTLALLVGWFLGRSSSGRMAAGCWSVFLGIAAILGRVGRLDRILWSLHRAWLTFVAAGSRFLLTLLRDSAAWQQLSPPDPTPLLRISAELGTAVSTLLTRTCGWLSDLLKGSSSYDPVAAMVFWGLLLWLAAAWAGWMVRRQHKALLAVTPAGVLAVTAISYVWGAPYILLLLIGPTLMLMVVVNYDERERAWRRAAIDFSRDLWQELFWLTSGIVIVVLVLSALIPSISIRDILDFAREVTVQRNENTEAAGESLGLYQTPEPIKQPTSVDRARAGGLPRRHLIGSGPELSRRVVMVIRTGDLTPTQELSPTVEPYRYYWRSVTYDIYGGQGWYASHVQVLDYDAGEQIHSPTQLHRRLVRQEVEVVAEAEEHLLHTAGILVAADQRYRVAWRPPGDIFAALTKSPVYRVDSLVPVVGAEELRAAGSDYPDWVLERYLTLPDEVPERVLALGRDLTATEPTPYDRALAIERYLRENYPYTLDVPQPPLNRDIADYFLFDLHKGYCDYYATAMTVLARAAGLPARLAIGYASGDYDAAEARYIVTEADAHAWTEIYFPEHGWITFEPTGGYPPLERPTEVEPIIWPEPQEPLRPPPSPPGPLARYWYLVLLGCGVAVALGVLIQAQLELLWLRTRPPAQVTTFLYRRLRRWGQRLDVEMHRGDTPYEFAKALKQRVVEIAGQRSRAGWLLPAGEEIHSLTEAYVQTWYTRHPSEAAGRDASLRTWRKLRWRLWLARLWGRRPTRLELTLTGGRVMEQPRKPRVLPHPYS